MGKPNSKLVPRNELNFIFKRNRSMNESCNFVETSTPIETRSKRQKRVKPNKKTPLQYAHEDKENQHRNVYRNTIRNGNGRNGSIEKTVSLSDVDADNMPNDSRFLKSSQKSLSDDHNEFDATPTRKLYCEKRLRNSSSLKSTESIMNTNPVMEIVNQLHDETSKLRTKSSDSIEDNCILESDLARHPDDTLKMQNDYWKQKKVPSVTAKTHENDTKLYFKASFSAAENHLLRYDLKSRLIDSKVVREILQHALNWIDVKVNENNDRVFTYVPLLDQKGSLKDKSHCQEIDYDKVYDMKDDMCSLIETESESMPINQRQYPIAEPISDFSPLTPRSSIIPRDLKSTLKSKWQINNNNVSPCKHTGSETIADAPVNNLDDITLKKKINTVSFKPRSSTSPNNIKVTSKSSSQIDFIHNSPRKHASSISVIEDPVIEPDDITLEIENSTIFYSHSTSEAPILAPKGAFKSSHFVNSWINNQKNNASSYKMFSSDDDVIFDNIYPQNTQNQLKKSNFDHLEYSKYSSATASMDSKLID